MNNSCCLVFPFGSWFSPRQKPAPIRETEGTKEENKENKHQEKEGKKEKETKAPAAKAKEEEDHRWKSAKPFVINLTEGFVVRVVDGDTIWVVGALSYGDRPMSPSADLHRFVVRLNGIDTPEMKGHSPEERACARLAQEEVSELILNKHVRLKCDPKKEKFGRILADVYLGELHVNEHLVQKRLAVRYFGKTKQPPADWMLYHATGAGYKEEE